MFCIAAGESGGGAFPLNNADRLPGGVTLHIHANSARAVPREEDSCSLPIAPSGPRNPRSQRATAAQLLLLAAITASGSAGVNTRGSGRQILCCQQHIVDKRPLTAAAVAAMARNGQPVVQ